jgi:antitoxin MazE
MNVTQDLQKWGNSTGIRLPKKVIDAAKLKPNQTMVISLKKNAIILTPAKKNDDFTLDSMLKGVTPQKVQGETDWSQDVGAEVIHG